MELLEQHRLVDVHRRLMQNVHAGQQSLEADLTKRIAALGAVTQEVLVNTAGDDGETALSVACTKNALPLIGALLKSNARPTPELFERLIRLQTPESLNVIVQLVPYATERTLEYAFLVACLSYNRPVIKHFLDLALPIEWIDPISTGKHSNSLYQSELRNVLIRVVRDADVELMQLLDPAIELFPVPLFETLYLTAAFYANEAVTRYLLKRMGASIEAKIRAAEIMAARAQLTGDDAEAQRFLEEERKYRGQAPPVYDGDMTGLLTEDNIKLTNLDPNLMALTVMEKHFRHRHEFQEALLMRPYTIKISIYALDVIMHAEESTTENVNIIWQQLRDLQFDQCVKSEPIMKCLEWVVAAMGYIDEEYRDLRLINPVGDPNESEELKELKERVKNLRKPDRKSVV